MEEIIREDGRYAPEAYAFLHEALSQAVKVVHGEEAEESGQRHVTGPELCKAIRELAVERWGLMAKAVLNQWNIHQTVDFGNMVYLLIRHGYMRKTEEDNLDDFRDVYDFERAFEMEDPHELKE